MHRIVRKAALVVAVVGLGATLLAPAPASSHPSSQAGTPFVAVGGPAIAMYDDNPQQATTCTVVTRVIPNRVGIGGLEVEDYLAVTTSVCEGDVPVTTDMQLAIHDGPNVIEYIDCPNATTCSVEFRPDELFTVKAVGRARWMTNNDLGWAVHNPMHCLERGVLGQMDCWAVATLPFAP